MGQEISKCGDRCGGETAVAEMSVIRLRTVWFRILSVQAA